MPTTSVLISGGFFNSINGDRKYNAQDMSKMYDGLLLEGVFEHVGDHFRITQASGNASQISVGSGRAWFDGVWGYSDTNTILDVPAALPLLDSVKTVILTIDSTTNGRSVSIGILDSKRDGTKETLINAGGVHQIPLGYVTRRSQSSGNTDLTITNVVGSETPFVSGILKQLDISDIVDSYRTDAQNLIGNYRDLFNSALNEFKVNSSEKIEQLNNAISEAGQAQLIDYSVSEIKLANGAVSTRTIQDGAVGTAKIGTDAVSSVLSFTLSASANYVTQSDGSAVHSATVQGMSENYKVVADVNTASGHTWATIQAELEAWALIKRVECLENTVKFYIDDGVAPEVDIPLNFLIFKR